MKPLTVYILAHGHYSETVDDTAPPLKALVKETTGESIRRVGRFIQLALIGAGRCLQHRRAPTDTAVYLTSGRGDLEITLEVLEYMIVQGLPPKPLSFINTVSNSACFYLAKHFGLHGRSHFVTRRYAPLECALHLAMLDMQSGCVQNALVGSVDICTNPLDDHRKRLGVSADTRVGEGSHWFLLGTHTADALATIVANVLLDNEADLQPWLVANLPDKTSTVVAMGQYLSVQTQARLAELIDIPNRLRVDPERPWYDSHCGAALGDFLNDTQYNTLLHIDADTDGRLSVLLLNRT